MAARGEELNTRITATDEASVVVDKVADKVEALEDKPHEVELDANTSKAEQAARQLDQRLDGLTNDEKLIVLGVQAKDAQRDIDRINRDLAKAEKFSDEEIQLRLEAKGNAEAKLKAIDHELDEIASSARNADREVEKIGDGIGSRLSSKFSGIGALAGSSLVKGLAAAGLTASAGELIRRAVTGFEDLAIAAGKFSDATRLNVADASRWIEVAGDVGVSTETIQGLFVRLNKALDSGTLAKYGAEAQRTGDGLVDVNATMLDTIRVIGQIKDPTQRAAAAQAAFGRGYAAAAEIIGASADDLKRRLAEVSDQKIIDPEELERARKAREQLDDLTDAAEDASIVIGEELVPVLGDLAEFLVDVKEKAGDAKDAIEKIPGGGSLLDALGTNLFELPKKSKQEWDDLGRKLGVLPPKADAVSDSLEEMIGHTVSVGPAMDDAADGIDDLADASDNATAATARHRNELTIFHETVDLATAAIKMKAEADERAAESATKLAEAWGEAVMAGKEGVDLFQSLRDELDLGSLLDDIAEGFDDITEAQADLADGGDEAGRRFRDQVRSQQERLLQLLQTYKDIPARKQTEIVALIRKGDLDSLNTALDEIIGQERFVKVGLIMPDVHKAFEGINVTVGKGLTPKEQLIGATAPPQRTFIDNSTTIVVPPPGSQPTQGYVDARLYNSRNQFSRTAIR